MSYANYRQIENAISRFEPFVGNSAHADYVGNIYTIYSYGTIIGQISFQRGSVVLNARKYSNTTSRLQNIIRKVWADFTISEVS